MRRIRKFRRYTRSLCVRNMTNVIATRRGIQAEMYLVPRHFVMWLPKLIREYEPCDKHRRGRSVSYASPIAREQNSISRHFVQRRVCSGNINLPHRDVISVHASSVSGSVFLSPLSSRSRHRPGIIATADRLTLSANSSRVPERRPRFDLSVPSECASEDYLLEFILVIAIQGRMRTLELPREICDPRGFIGDRRLRRERER